MARNYIRELESFRLIETVQNGKCTSNDYVFLDHPWMHEENAETNYLPDRQKPSSPSRQMNSRPTIEENQSLRESVQEHTQNTVPNGIPSSPEEAIMVANQLRIPEDFAREEYHAKKAVGWRDGYGNRIVSWPNHLQARWSVEQRKRTERRTSGRAFGKRRPAPPRQFTAADYNQSVKDF
jgi:hypothetical protein